MSHRRPKPFNTETLIRFVDTLKAEELGRGTNIHRFAMLQAIKSVLLEVYKQEKEETRKLKEKNSRV